jgi:hypothetical protein
MVLMSDIDIKKELVRNIAKIPEEKLLDLVAEYGSPGITDELKGKILREKCYEYTKHGIWESLTEEYGYLPDPVDVGEYVEFGGDPENCSIEYDYPDFLKKVRIYADLSKEKDWVGRTVKEFAGPIIDLLDKKGIDY